MKRFALFFGAFIIIALIAVFTIPFLIPKEVYKTQIETAATKALQRDVQLAGDVSLSVFPRISAGVQGVSVANAEGFDAPYMIEAGELRGSVKWLPLLSRRVEIQEIAFIDAKVDLQKLSDGRANWELAAPDDNASSGETGNAGGFDAGIASARLENAYLLFRDAQAGTRYELNELDLEASLQSLDEALKAEGGGLFQGERFDISLLLDSPNAATTGNPAALNASLKSALGDASFDGSLTLGDTPGAEGRFTASSDALSALIEFTGQEAPVNLAPLGRIAAEGSISGPFSALTITLDQASQSSELAKTNYKGTIKLGETPTLDGTIQAALPQTGAFLSQLGLDIPASEALEDFQLSSNVAGGIDALRLTNMSATHKGSRLNAGFNGDVSLAGDGEIVGQLTANSNALRSLLATADVELTPGETLQTFSIDGTIKGAFNNITISDLKLALDDVKGTGTLGADLTAEAPRIFGDLDMGNLDLSPFLGKPADEASKPASNTGWSKTPLDLTGLSSVNGNIKIRTQTLTIGNVTLTNATIDATLQNGQLIAELPTFQAFDGEWAGTMKVDTTQAAPALDIRMAGDRVKVSDLLGTFSGFDKLTGTGSFTVRATAQGESIDAIMNALDGEVSTQLKDGALKGLNVAQLIRSADSLKDVLTGGDLSDMNFGNVLSEAAETDFTNFNTTLTITDGVANVDLLKLLNPVLGIDGSGQINLGKQKLDLRLATSIDKQAVGDGSVIQLNGIPVPVRLSGDWSNLKVSPDLDGVKSALKAELGGQLRDELSDRLGNQLGGNAGGILGDVLGVPRKTETPTAPPADTPSETNAPVPQSDAETDTKAPDRVDPRDAIEDAAEQAAKDALGGLFGRRKAEPKKEAETDAPASNSE